MTPLIIITAYNRRKLTMQTLDALEKTTALDAVDLVVINDASTDDTHEHLAEWIGPERPANIYHMPNNIGCPRALNYVMARHRSIGQPVVKIDNDVEMLTEGWVPAMWEFLAHAREIFGAMGMIMAHYPGCTKGRLAQAAPIEILGHNTWIMEHTIGHAVWHTGALLDEVGFFDVLAEGHRYGFEDLLMSVKARMRGMAMLVWEGWQICNLQRSSSLGAAGRDAHVAEMRPLYEARRAALRVGGPTWTNALGQPSPVVGAGWSDRYGFRAVDSMAEGTGDPHVFDVYNDSPPSSAGFRHTWGQVDGGDEKDQRED